MISPAMSRNAHSSLACTDARTPATHRTSRPSGERVSKNAPSRVSGVLSIGSRVVSVTAPLPAAENSIGAKPPSESSNAGAHEALDELALEEHERDQQRRRGHQGGGGDDRPVDALIGRREDLQADGQRPRG